MFLLMISGFRLKLTKFPDQLYEVVSLVALDHPFGYEERGHGAMGFGSKIDEWRISWCFQRHVLRCCMIFRVWIWDGLWYIIMIGWFFYRIRLLACVGFCTEFYTYALWKAAKHSPMASFGQVCMCWTRDFTTCHHTRESWAHLPADPSSVFWRSAHFESALQRDERRCESWLATGALGLSTVQFWSSPSPWT